jgi:hypothetical protein
MLLRAEHIPPRPESIPSPPQKGSAVVKLADLLPHQYVGVVARVVSMRAREVCDNLGSKQVLSGVLEDETFRVPYVCHKTSLPLERGAVLEISSAYVHEFKDRSLLLVLTGHTEARLRDSEDATKYCWLPKIGGIKRPVWNAVLYGTVSRIYDSSGLVKRCNGCKAIVYGSCPNGCDVGWEWDLRVSALLQDQSGAMRMVMGRYLSSKVLGRNLGEVFHLARTRRVEFLDGFKPVAFNLALPDKLSIMEALVEDPSKHRKHGKLVISDGVMRIFFPKGEELCGDFDAKEMVLNRGDEQDRKLTRRLVEKAIEIRIDGIIGRSRAHGMYSLEDPLPLYWCERAKLYVGFSIDIAIADGRIIVEALPQARVQESVLEYIRWRRERGATAQAIERNLLTYRANVVTAPFGHPAKIEELVFARAGEEVVSELDGRDFTRFWRETYDIRVAPDETPLVRVKLPNLDLSLTYPPSCVSFTDGSFPMKEGVRRFIEAKRASVRDRVQGVMANAVHGIRIGYMELKAIDGEDQWLDTQRLILHEVKDKLLGRAVKARGNISWLNGQLYFFPSDIMLLR